jgi:hypothetical protein
LQQQNPVRALIESVEVPRLRTRYSVPLLAAVVVGAMLLLGGAWAPSVPLLALVAGVALAVTGVDRSALRRDPVVPLFGALLAVSALQLAPLPGALLHLLDAASEEASRLAWSAWRIDRTSTWRALHRDPGTGRLDFVYLMGLAAAYLATVQAARRDGLERLYMACAASALLCAALGFAHLSTGQDLVYGYYRPAQAAPPVLSPLLNANHLAALMGVGVILWLGLALEADKALAKVIHGSAAVACGAICALTLSRGGVACAVGGVAVLFALDARTVGEERKVRRRPALQTWLGYGAAAATFLGGAWLASSSLAREYGTGDRSKLEVFRRALGLLRGHELFGYGSGALPVVSVTAGRLDADRTFLRVESLPLDLVLGVGVIAGGAAMYFGVRALRRWFPPADAPPTALAAWAAVLSLVAHDLVDFSLYVGGVGYVAAVLAGVLSAWYARGWRKPLPRAESLVRWPGFAVALAVVALGATAWHSNLEADRDAVERSLRTTPSYFLTDDARAAVARHPSDPYLQLVLGSYAVSEGHPTALRFVARAMELAPTWAQPHLLLARILAAGNRRSQTLLEVSEVLTRTANSPGPCARVALRLRPPPTREELQRVAPRNWGGVAFLNGMALGAPDAAYAAMADGLLLERADDFVAALERRAYAARIAGDLDGAERYCARIERAQPAEPAGTVCLVEVQLSRGDAAEAMRSLDRALGRVRDKYPLHRSRARLFARRNDLAAMRRETAAMLETGGSDLQRLVLAHALRGELEANAGANRAAYTAYEMAHSLAVPETPYAMQMAVLASRMGDRPALEAQCGALLEREPVEPAARELCDPAGARRARGDAGAAAEPAAVQGSP